MPPLPYKGQRTPQSENSRVAGADVPCNNRWFQHVYSSRTKRSEPQVSLELSLL